MLKNTFIRSGLTRRIALITGAAALGLAMLPALAAPGFDPGQAAQVRPGMTQDAVRQVMGEPGQTQRYAISNTSTWTYDVDPVAMEQVFFDVDFGADGRVASSGERRVPSPG